MLPAQPSQRLDAVLSAKSNRQHCRRNPLQVIFRVRVYEPVQPLVRLPWQGAVHVPDNTNLRVDEIRVGFILRKAIDNISLFRTVTAEPPGDRCAASAPRAIGVFISLAGRRQGPTHHG